MAASAVMRLFSSQTLHGRALSGQQRASPPARLRWARSAALARAISLGSRSGTHCSELCGSSGGVRAKPHLRYTASTVGAHVRQKSTFSEVQAAIVAIRSPVLCHR